MASRPDRRARAVADGTHSTTAGIARSDWWPAALGAARWRAWHKESQRTNVTRDAAPPQCFGPGYAIARLLATPLYRTLWRVHVEGGGRLPQRGPAILAANHVSFFDSVVLIMTLRRTLSFVGKVEYLDSWKTRRVLPALGMIPVDRSDGRRAMAALKIASEVLRGGNMFAIYPEGTRSQDGDLQAGHTGAAYLSMATGVPIVPTGIVGTDRIQPPGTQGPAPVPTSHCSVRRPDRPGGLRREPPPSSTADHQRPDGRHPVALRADPGRPPGDAPTAERPVTVTTGTASKDHEPCRCLRRATA